MNYLFLLSCHVPVFVQYILLYMYSGLYNRIHIWIVCFAFCGIRPAGLLNLGVLDEASAVLVINANYYNYNLVTYVYYSPLREPGYIEVMY